jgi:FkbM family methyltransferase
MQGRIPEIIQLEAMGSRTRIACACYTEVRRMLTATILISVGLSTVVVLVAAYAAIVIRKRRKKARFVTYGHDVRDFQLDREGTIQYAQWLHPKDSEKVVTQEQVDAIRQYVKEGDTVIDIGAHSGDTTIPMAIAAGRTGCAFAFEPNPHVFAVLETNASLNPEKTNIVPLNLAATEEDGEFVFHYSDGGFCNGGFLSRLNRRHGHHSALTVKGRVVEELLASDYPERISRLALIKVDAEGYDAQVLKSMLGLIQKCKPVIICECYKRLTDEERKSLFDVLDGAGYECHRQADSGWRPQERVARGDMSNWPHFDIIAFPRDKQATRAA